MVNENKAKSMFISRRESLQKAITIKNLSFKRVCNFKYLGVDINSQGGSDEEIHKISAA